MSKSPGKHSRLERLVELAQRKGNRTLHDIAQKEGVTLTERRAICAALSLRKERGA